MLTKFSAASANQAKWKSLIEACEGLEVQWLRYYSAPFLRALVSASTLPPIFWGFFCRLHRAARRFVLTDTLPNVGPQELVQTSPEMLVTSVTAATTVALDVVSHARPAVVKSAIRAVFLTWLLSFSFLFLFFAGATPQNTRRVPSSSQVPYFRHAHWRLESNAVPVSPLQIGVMCEKLGPCMDNELERVLRKLLKKTVRQLRLYWCCFGTISHVLLSSTPPHTALWCGVVWWVGCRGVGWV